MAHGGAALFCACGRARFRERVFGPYRLPPVKPLKSFGQVFGFSLVGFASFSFSFSLVLVELWFCFVLVLFLFALVLVLFMLVQSEFVFFCLHCPIIVCPRFAHRKCIAAIHTWPFSHARMVALYVISKRGVQKKVRHLPEQSLRCDPLAGSSRMHGWWHCM